MCRRAATILSTTFEICSEMGRPLTPEQKTLLGSCVLAAFMDVEGHVQRMVGTFEAGPFSDERLVAWLDEPE